MANTFTYVNDTKVQAACIGALKLGLTPLRAFSLGVGSDPANKFDTFNVPLVTARTTTANATDYEDGNTTAAGAQVSLNTNISCSWHITAVQASKTNTNLFESAAVEAIYAMSLLAQQTVLELAVAASFAAEVVKASTALDLDALQDIRKYCVQDLKWRMNDGTKTSLVLDGAYYANLMKDPAVRDRSASDMNIAKDGVSARAAGFDIYENGVIAGLTAYGASEYLRGFACQQRCLAVAIKPPTILGQAGFLTNEYVTDPDDPDGITFNYRTWITPKSNTLWGAAEILFGAVKVDGSAMYRIVSQ